VSRSEDKTLLRTFGGRCSQGWPRPGLRAADNAAHPALFNLRRRNFNRTARDLARVTVGHREGASIVKPINFQTETLPPLVASPFIRLRGLSSLPSLWEPQGDGGL
jgi:hypothetical protein